MATMLSLTAEVEHRDPSLGSHSERVTEIAQAVARRLRCGPGDLRAIELGGPLHDIGKLTIPEEVLLKPGRLDQHELLQIRSHPQAGARLLEGVRALRAALPCVLHHHERWDGSGYPFGLAGALIPRAARILAVADAFDAMTTTRPYRRALLLPEALHEVRRCAGTQFDPEASDAFLVAWNAGEIRRAQH
ncbi:MAG TPA: HD-GYP domain-containing protein [Gaiellaceae bacterium]|jgi:HD-GYP domain-containing protein (c-di-GMP phosphodiesterase class II)|nr:HD-GYP domain-containing protein [Gaiellaceae bacterium]